MEAKDDFLSDEEDNNDVVSVTVKVGSYKFKVPIGNGSQSIKWLGLVASTRYSDMSRENNKLDQNDQWITGNYTPSCISLFGTCVDPGVLLSDLLKENRENLEFEVELAQEIKLSEGGTPILDSWTIQAFCHSDEAKAKYESVATGGTVVADDEQLEKPQIFESTFPSEFHSPFENPEQIVYEMEKDWLLIKNDKSFSAMFGTQENAIEQVKVALLESFENIGFLIHFYSWTSRNDSLTANECLHMLHCGGLFDLSDTYTEFLGVATFPQMERWQVILTVLKLVYEKREADVYPYWDLVAVLREQLNPVAEKLQNRKNDSLVAQVLLRTKASKLIYKSENMSAFREVFERYCINSAYEESELVISLEEFAIFYADIQSHQLEDESKCDVESKSFRESKESGAVLERLKKCKNLFKRAQTISQDGCPILPNLVFQEFVLATCNAWFDKEDVTDNHHGGIAISHLLDFINTLI